VKFNDNKNILLAITHGKYRGIILTTKLLPIGVLKKSLICFLYCKDKIIDQTKSSNNLE
jgi:hypothetical protein